MIWPGPYLAMARFVRPAMPFGGWGKVIVTVLAVELAFTALTARYAVLSPFAAASQLQTVLDFALFALPAAALLVSVRILHGQRPAEIVGTRTPRPAFLAAAAGVALVLAAQEPLLLWMDLAEGPRLQPVLPWLFWLVPGLAAILVQTGTEELIYRGYLQQQLGAVSTRPLVWMVLPSIWFGAGHLWNGDTLSEGVLWAIWATFVGLACADLTARTGNIAAAVGLHFSNNVFATVLIDTQGAPSSGLALWLFPADEAPLDPAALPLFGPWTPVDILLSALSVLVMWLAARVALRV